MISYFCISNTGKEFLYVPFNLFVYDSTKSQNLNFYWNPEVLSNLTLLLKERKLSREKLEDKNWDVFELEIPDKILKKFRGFCEKCKNKRKILKLASRIFNWVEDSFDAFENEKNKASNQDEDSNSDEYEDYLDDWWLRGENPPDYKIDNRF